MRITSSSRFVASLVVACLAALMPSVAMAQAAVTPTITLSGLPATTLPTTPLNITAQVSGSSGTATGSVSFIEVDTSNGGSIILCNNYPLDGTGSAACTFSAPLRGSYQIVVNYSGDSNYTSASGTFAFTTQQVASSISLANLAASYVSGDAISVTATVTSSSSLGNPTGSLAFLEVDTGNGGSIILCNNVPLDAAGSASCGGFTAPPPGNWQIVVNYSGDGPNAAASQAFGFTTLRLTPTTSIANLPATAAPGQALNPIATFASGRPLTGVAVFFLVDTGNGGTTILCNNVPLDPSNSAACAFSAPSVGNWQLAVRYSGDTANNGTNQAFAFSTANPTVVTNTSDDGLLLGSLRYAINYVNANCSGQTITFNLPIEPVGPKTIHLAGALPLLNCPGMTIDGYTQPGASPNTLAVGDNAVLLIEIDGTNGGDVNGILQIGAGSVTLRGLVLGGLFAPSGIRSCGVVNLAPAGSGNSTVAGNFIGTDPTGMAAHASYCGIGNFGGTAGLTIGGPSPADRNVIAGNRVHNVFLYSGNGVLIQGNYIGVDATGNAALSGTANGLMLLSGAGGTNAVVQGNVINGNNPAVIVAWPFTTLVSNLIGVGADGVTALPTVGNQSVVVGEPNVTIGGPSGSGNVIANNGGFGVQVQPFGVDPAVSILGNSIYGNANRGIDLSYPLANDSCDADSAQNFPVLSSATSIGGNTTIVGTLNSRASTTFHIEFFSNLAADNASNKAGRVFLGATTVTTSASCTATINATLPVSVAGGDTITATATNTSTGSTGWFSNAVTVSTTAPAVSLSSASLTFGAQLVGTSSSPQMVTLTNSGNAPLTISGLSVGADFSKSTNCPASPSTLAAGASCGIDVAFAPGSMGNLSEALTITSNAPGSPHTVALSGPGVSPPTFSIPTFTSRTAGQVSTVGVAIGNPFGNPVTFSGFNVTLAYPPGFVNDTSRPVQTSCSASVSTTGTSISATGGSDSPGVTCTVVSQQIFVSSVPGTYTFTIPAGGFTITSPFAYSNPSPITATVVVSAAPTGAGVGFTPPSLTFSPQPVGTTSPSQAVTLTNTGGSTLTISAITVSANFSKTTTCGTSLAAGATCTINVAFAPTSTGAISGTLSVTSNAVGSPHTMPLSGTGLAANPSITLTPSSLSFAARTVGTTSSAQTVTLGNSGPGTLTIASITISGDFAFASTCASTLPQGGTCTIDITFTPIAAGTRIGSLTITSNASGSPHGVALAGTGQSAAVGVLEVTPSPLQFDPQAPGTTSTPQLLVLHNSGTATVNRGPESVGGDFRLLTGTEADAATQNHTCGASIAAGDSCNLALVFTPTALGTRTGAIALPNDTATPVVTVRLLGTGANPTVPRVLTVQPQLLAFGEQAVGTQSAGKNVTLTNTSSASASITGLDTNPRDFGVSDTCATIAPHASCSALVTFQPTAVGPRTGTLTIRTFSETDPYVVQLTGTGIFSSVPALQISVTRVGFGNVLLGGSAVSGVTLTNIGLVPVVLGSMNVLDDFIVASACGATLDPGASCSVQLTFFPHTLGVHAATLDVFSNAANSPHHVDLSGTGCAIPTPTRARVRPVLCGP
jgi:uncharacterized protein YfaP (DUF2135 family)